MRPAIPLCLAAALVLSACGIGQDLNRPGCHALTGSDNYHTRAATNIRRAGDGYLVDVYDRRGPHPRADRPTTVYLSNIQVIYYGSGMVGGCD